MLKKIRYLFVFACICLLIFPEISYSRGLSEKKPEERKDSYLVVIFRPGPKWVKGKAMFEQPNISDHAKHYMGPQGKNFKAVFAGYFVDKTGGIVIYDSTDDKSLREFIEKDPLAQSEVFKIDFMSAIELEKKVVLNNPDKKVHNCVIALIQPGPKWFKEKSLFDQQDFQGHAKHIKKTEEELFFGCLLKNDEGGIVGKLGIYNIEDVEKIRINLMSDPMVQSKVVSLELHPLFLF